jgi:hypothetical protein
LGGCSTTPTYLPGGDLNCDHVNRSKSNVSKHGGQNKYTLQQVGHAPSRGFFSQSKTAASLTSATKMEGRILGEDEKTNGGKERRQSRDDHRVESLLAKSGRKACPSSSRRNIDKSGHKTSITETCTRYEALEVVVACKNETRVVENTVASRILHQTPLQSPVARPVLPFSGEILTSPATRPQKRTSKDSG